LLGLFFGCVKTVFTKNSPVTVPHPPYSCGFPLSDFWLFGHIKTSLASHIFNGVGELLEAIVEF
jgi:hypothetical protein